MIDEEMRQLVRQDCLASLKLQPKLATLLRDQRIAVVGGTGFIGTWIAETVAVLNDELGGATRLDLFGRSASAWKTANPRLAAREDLQVKRLDVRSSFDFSNETTLVLFAAGIADPRVHASDPFLVHETALQGAANTLAAASRLESLHRFVNLSSGLVLGEQMHYGALKESDIGLLDFTRVHNAYAESRRAAESLVSLYASQYRIPVSTARAFTFLGPYQSLDAPWAVTNFMRDALFGNEIRLHGDGATRRSYLYGSDAAAWLLRMLIDGRDGAVYNLGGKQVFSHSSVAKKVASLTVSAPSLIFKSQPAITDRRNDFIPDLANVKASLGLSQALDIDEALMHTMKWHAYRLGMLRSISLEQG